jgi:hypothetical protein
MKHVIILVVFMGLLFSSCRTVPSNKDSPNSLEIAKPLTASVYTSLDKKEALEFSEQVLKSIANRKPDFEDDFNSANNGWTWWMPGEASQNNPPGKGELIDGVARMTLTGNSDILLNNSNLKNLKDFVLMLDGKMVSGSEKSQLQVFTRIANNNWYGLNISPGTQSFESHSSLHINDFRSSNRLADSISPIGENTNIIIIVKGNKYALYLNKKPQILVENTWFNTERDIWIMSRGAPDVITEFDNIKLWRI